MIRTASRNLVESLIRTPGASSGRFSTVSSGRFLQLSSAHTHVSSRTTTRCFSRTAFLSKDDDTTTFSTTDNNTTNPSADETLNKLFEDSQQQLAEAASTGDAWFAAGESAAASWDPTWYNLADQAIVSVHAFHDMTGLEYGWSIVGVTVILRLALFPLMVQTQRTTSRMAHLQPELTLMKNRYEALGTPSRQDQVQFGKQMQSLFAKFEVKPFNAFLAPLVQLPLFMGMFFGLRKMPELFPTELSTGGMFWFVDLTIPDPTYILPLAASGSFLILIEAGKDQMMAQNAAQGQLMVNVFRFMSLAMIPVCVGFEASMLCYWTANNALTLSQTLILKTPAVRKQLGIWDPPKPVPGMAQAETLTETATKLVDKIQGKATTDKQKIQRHNEAVDAKKRAFGMMRKRRAAAQGITGTRNR